MLLAMPAQDKTFKQREWKALLFPLVQTNGMSLQSFYADAFPSCQQSLQPRRVTRMVHVFERSCQVRCTYVHCPHVHRMHSLCSLLHACVITDHITHAHTSIRTCDVNFYFISLDRRTACISLRRLRLLIECRCSFRAILSSHLMHAVNSVDLKMYQMSDSLLVT